MTNSFVSPPIRTIAEQRNEFVTTRSNVTHTISETGDRAGIVKLFVSPI